MTARAHDPRRLDIERFAAEDGSLRGVWPLVGMPRLAAACHAADVSTASGHVAWQASAERRKQGASEAQPWLRLVLDASLGLTCQRCLAAVETRLEVDRWFRFVEGEKQAAELDADSDEDVLARTRSLDLHELAEDELLLALPLVPRHTACPVPLLPDRTEGEDGASTAPNPFAALAVLKRGAN